jgi:hypothetical protein
MTPEVVKNLTDFAQGGGDLIVDARQARALPESLTGVRLGGEAKGLLTYTCSDRRTFEEQPYTYQIMSPGSAATVLVTNESGHPLLTVAKAGQGRIVVCAADYWMTDKLTYRTPEIVNMEPPYRLLHGVEAVLREYFGSFSPVEVSPAGLNVRTCCYAGDAKRLLVGLMNNDLFADWTGVLKVKQGRVASAEDWWRGGKLSAGNGMKLTIPAGEAAIIALRLQ